MKKPLFAMTVLCCVAGLASAQSSVTVYGIADAGIQVEDGAYAAGSLTSVISGGHSGSRLGFRGKEELGSGLFAIFNLQSGINLDDGSLGQGGLIFGRTAFVGLEGSFGSVKLGRIDSPLYQSTWAYDPLVDGLGGAFTRVFTLTSTYRRNNNTLDYTSPTVAGFSGQASYSFGEVAGSSESGRRYSAALNYNRGPIAVSVAHQRVNSIPVGAAALVSTKLSAIGGSYDFKVVKLSALYQVNKDDAATALDTRDALLGVLVPFGVHAVAASYIRHEDKRVSTGDADQLALAYTYALSKRTNLYAGASRISNDATARFGLASVAAGGSASGTTAKLYTAGLRHTF